MKTFRVALISAPVIAIVESWYDTPEFGRPSLAYLAGYLRQSPGFEILVIDAKFERLNFDQVMKRLEEFQPDLVGFTAFTNEIKPSAYLAALVKDRFPKAVTLVGGPHVTAIPVATLNEFPTFDIVAIGEGEQTLHELCESLREGDDFREVHGLAYREGTGVVLSAPRDRILDQDSIPHPAWDLLPPAKQYWVQTERGCPFNCHFCMNHNGRVPRKRSVENVIGELRHILDVYKPTTIRFGDELFTVDMARSMELMDAIIEAGLNDRLKWDCQTHVRFVDVALLKKMKQAGCYLVEMGVETGDEGKLRKMGKGTTPNVILAAGAAAREAKIPFGTFLIVGQPDETMESIRQTQRLAVKLNPHLPTIGIMCPYPGTEVSRLAAKGEAGFRLLTTDWDEYNKQIGGAMAFANLTRTQIELIHIRMYCAIYLLNFRFIDFIKFVWEYRSGAFSVLKKMILGKNPSKMSKLRPVDYEQRINAGAPTTVDQLIQARHDWSEYQKREMVRTKKLNPNLLSVITAT